MDALIRAAVWRAWKDLPPGTAAPVKTIAARLGLATAEVAAVVYPDPELFGEWSDDDEPEP